MRDYDRLFKTVKRFCMEKLVENNSKGDWIERDLKKHESVKQNLMYADIELKEVFHSLEFGTQRELKREISDCINHLSFALDELENREDEPMDIAYYSMSGDVL